MLSWVDTTRFGFGYLERTALHLTKCPKSVLRVQVRLEEDRILADWDIKTFSSVDFSDSKYQWDHENLLSHIYKTKEYSSHKKSIEVAIKQTTRDAEKFFFSENSYKYLMGYEPVESLWV